MTSMDLVRPCPRAQAALRADPSTDISVVALDLPCTFFMLRAAAALPIVEPVARRFRWSPRIEALADKVCDGIAAATGAMHQSFGVSLYGVAVDMHWISKQPITPVVAPMIAKLEPTYVEWGFAGGKGYNGVHLRIEKDAEAWAQILGGRDVLLDRYVTCAQVLLSCYMPGSDVTPSMNCLSHSVQTFSTSTAYTG